ncbi:TPA: hypothetical protein QDC22_001322 [Burkholderia stabilis]|uniref:hypothetical protein n=1 Tax=Burkholderia stabilis TaxID=95485 RepID=UPI00158CD19D|nr:hypothetical protein [Burkholderia stabilis]HDR9584174.1 hypothetical protein [Burkholderia stabilis]HDR9647500.1 hypothetical protein [Burkholderia stabilis]HDR9655929.1 hypothetical protein [Burkholderia stabilis]HDR9678589.1 hypothetical protein [Burkholderia stabilis]
MTLSKRLVPSCLLGVALIELLALLVFYMAASSMEDPYAGVRAVVTALVGAAAISVIGFAAGIAYLAIDLQARGAAIKSALALHGLLVLPGLYLYFH